MTERPGAPYGVLLVDKPAGPTSHDVVQWVRWVLRTRAVGHCGTLDPAATGLLVCGVGPATRLTNYLTPADKTYEATFALGRATTTADAEGEPTEQAPVPAQRWDQVAAATAGLVGEHSLPPPAFSAVRIEGRRAHELARAGEQPELAPRPMTVVSIADVVVDAPAASVRATLRVSKGTYIRALAVELGRRLEVPAHLAGLRRTVSGALRVDDARCVTNLVAQRLEGPRPKWRLRPGADPEATRDAMGAAVGAALLPIADALPFPAVTVDPSARPELWRRLADGRAVAAADLDPVDAERIAVIGPPACIIVRRDDDHWAPERTIVAP